MVIQLCLKICSLVVVYKISPQMNELKRIDKKEDELMKKSQFAFFKMSSFKF